MQFQGLNSEFSVQLNRDSFLFSKRCQFARRSIALSFTLLSVSSVSSFLLSLFLQLQVSNLCECSMLFILRILVPIKIKRQINWDIFLQCDWKSASLWECNFLAFVRDPPFTCHIQPSLWLLWLKLNMLAERPARLVRWKAAAASWLRV